MYSTTYRLSGRAERIHEEDDGTLVATIRIDRDRGVYESDRKVAAATALAARGSKYSVTRVRVETNSDAREFDFPSEDEQLALHIRGEMAEAREIKSGNGGEARPTPARCFSCEYAYACSESQSGT
ncbi:MULTISPECIES: hypothetical protein [unclassified Thioalkalivibrio]|uniref:hypothetical protein n=1 Tax=unclassified Thioalkalivibrio TaxID=2621013 RepID=UPI001E48D8C5|nr:MULTISPECIES: hypothetical protein [unclassified Thioalkalivibrio]